MHQVRDFGRDFGRYPKEAAGRSLAERQLAEKLRRARKAKQFSPEEEVELQALQQAETKTEEKKTEELMPQVRQKTEELMQQVRDFGRYPKENAGRSRAERQLAERVRKAQKAKQFSPEEEVELQALQQADTKTEAKTEELMQQVRDLGRFPKETAGRSQAERQLAAKVRRARKEKQFSAEEEVELQALQQADTKTEAKTEELMQQVRDLGRLPKENAGA